MARCPSYVQKYATGFTFWFTLKNLTCGIRIKTIQKCRGVFSLQNKLKKRQKGKYVFSGRPFGMLPALIFGCNSALFYDYEFLFGLALRYLH
jgi:hypothetical protein